MRTWTTPDGLAFEDEQTGDGRLFVAGSLYWDDAPNGWPLRYAPTDEGGHFGAELVGAIGTLARTGNAITGTGQLDDEANEAGALAATQLDQGTPLGVSVDLDDMEIEWVLSDPDEVQDDEVVLLAASVPHGRIVWREDGTVGVEAPGIRPLLASAGLVAAAGDGEPEDGVILWAEAMDDVVARVTRARVRGATLVDLPAFARAAIALDPAGTADAGQEGEPADVDAALAAAGGCTPCLAEQLNATVTAAARRLGSPAPVAPPREWFRTPADYDRHVIEVTDPMTGTALRGVPMTYGDDGRVFGHIALWGQCHTGSNGQCVLTPRSASGLTWFHHGHVITAEGDTLATGNLTCGGGHADVLLSYRAALEHYDNVSTLHAQLVAVEDELGVFVAGAGMPDVWGDPVAMRKLRAGSPSGDWRPIGRAQELTIAHVVNGPGFPVPRARVASSGSVEAIVAASGYEVALLNRRAQGASESDVEAMLTRAVAAGIASYRADEERREADAAARAARARLRRLDPAREAARARLAATR